MSDGNSLLAVTLGTAGGLLLAYLRRADEGVAPTSPVHPPPSVPTPPGTTPASQGPPPARPTAPRACALRLDAKGLTADGQTVDVPQAVARCKAAGRADLVFASDGPASVYVELNRALFREGVRVEVSGE
jgi:hypothetical protein